MTTPRDRVVLKDMDGNHVVISIEEITKGVANGGLLLFGLTMQEIGKLVQDRLKKPNVVFGVLTNGEIFVEVGGKQHTPAPQFYKMATIQSTKLAHQVRDLQLKVCKLQSENLPELMRLRKENEQFRSMLDCFINDMRNIGELS